MLKYSDMKQGFWQAIGVTTYCALVGFFMWNSGKILPEPESFLMPVAFLTLLCSSVLVCGLLVFYKPYKLFFDGKKREAMETVLFTAVYLVGVFILLMTGLLLFR